MKLSIGADPEFFLSRDGVPVSAHNIVPGTKEKPHKLEKGAVQADGTAVEFNIEPAFTAQEFHDNIACVLRQVRALVPKEYTFEFVPSVEYEKAYFRRIPLKSRALGCDPDFNAWDGKMNVLPRRVGSLRTGAGHIHIGWGQGLSTQHPDHLWDCRQVVQALDRVIPPLERVWCRDDKRRKLYGKLGAFRPKPYGVEYRVLSNSWLNHQHLWKWLFNSFASVVYSLERGNDTWDGDINSKAVVPGNFQTLNDANMGTIPRYRYEDVQPWQNHS